jgi:predicted nucleic acid-binding protein
MKTLNSREELSGFLQELAEPPLCLADTGFLYALAYDDDRLFKKATDIFELLCEHQIEIYANVVSRMEFVDLIFRKQVTQGCIELFNTIKSSHQNESLLNLLKDIRDKDTAARRQNQSYKIDERRLKKLRETIGRHGVAEWQLFCKKFVGNMLVSEWTMIEKELGLNFIEIMDGNVSEYFTSPLKWTDMVKLMGGQGLRGPDAMILNLFTRSKIQVLITADSDFQPCFSKPLDIPSEAKAIFCLT